MVDKDGETMKNDKLAGLVHDVANVSGVELVLNPPERVVYGRYEAQVMSRKVVRVDIKNAHGEWEILIEGGENEVYVALTAAKRLYDVALQLRFRA